MIGNKVALLTCVVLAHMPMWSSALGQEKQKQVDQEGKLEQLFPQIQLMPKYIWASLDAPGLGPMRALEVRPELTPGNYYGSSSAPIGYAFIPETTGFRISGAFVGYDRFRSKVIENALGRLTASFTALNDDDLVFVSRCCPGLKVLEVEVLE